MVPNKDTPVLPQDAGGLVQGITNA